MKNHLVSDNNWNIVNLLSPPKKIYKDLALVTLHRGLQLLLSKTIRIDDH